MYNHVLIPVDGSELSEGARQAAIALAKRLDARLTVFYALPTAGAYAYATVPPFDGSFLTGSGAMGFPRFCGQLLRKPAH
ncbi:universal stress protein [Synechococcus sp. UW140]|uniref:universal stress protein n=1 Tax=Synechococcus sp. UW140 TaxID=368503 RepID=UPI003137A9E5